MKILLACVGFKNKEINFNKNQIIKVIKTSPKDIDLIVFGESFLQGFDSLSRNYTIDKQIAISKSDKIIKEISEHAKENNVAVSFGYFEFFNESIYSSQIVINHKGIIIHNYRRISKGWKEISANENYKEGDECSFFVLKNKKIAISLCGDLWFDENIIKYKNLELDLLLWPVYTDFNYNVWNNTEKYSYANQVKSLKCPVLYVNSYYLDKEYFEIARGGATHFKNGKIIQEVSAGTESTLIVTI